jgi:hypothetical protein
VADNGKTHGGVFMFLDFEDVKKMLRRMLSPMVNDHLVIRSDGLSQQTRSRVAMKGKFVSIYSTEIRGSIILHPSSHTSARIYIRHRAFSDYKNVPVTLSFAK